MKNAIIRNIMCNQETGGIVKSKKKSFAIF